MKQLTFTLNGQRLSKKNISDFQNIQKGTKQYLMCSFDCSGEWKNMLKIATFSVFAKKINVPIINNKCLVPDDITDWSAFELVVNGKKGVQIVTTNAVEIKQEG